MEDFQGLRREILPNKREKYFDRRFELPNRRQVVMSPSRRYELTIRRYRTKNRCLGFSKGTIHRAATDEWLFEIKRDYPTFNHSFVEKNGEEWLISGCSYKSQTMVNLETGLRLESRGDDPDFCWDKCFLSPDGNTLVVRGCMWAEPYEYRFYDFTNPQETGWSRLYLDSRNYIDVGKDGIPPEFDGETIICNAWEEYFLPLEKFCSEIEKEDIQEIGEDEYVREINWVSVENATVVLRRIGEEMAVIRSEIPEEDIEQIETAIAEAPHLGG